MSFIRTTGRRLLLLLLTAFVALPTLAQSPIAVQLNGRPLEFQGAQPQQIGGRVMVPLRGVFEALGAAVTYTAATQTIAAQRGATQMTLRIGFTDAVVNGQMRRLDVPAQIIGGSTMVPLRFVGEALGTQVSWNDALKTVFMTDAGTTTGAPTPAPVFNTPNAATITGVLRKVDPTLPATITIRVGEADKPYPVIDGALVYRVLRVAANATATPVARPAAPAALTALLPGEEVKLTLDATGQVTQIAANALITPARVQFAQGNRIVLDNDQNTTLTVGPGLQFVDEQGRSTMPTNLQPGQSIVLYVAPTNRAVYRVSVAASDVAAVGGGTTTGGTTTTGGNPPLTTGGTTATNSGAPSIKLVTHNAPQPLKAGAAFTVTLRGTAGMRASFDIATRAQGIALAEDPQQPGVYTGTYTVKPGDDVLKGRILGRLVSATNVEDTMQSTNTITLDTVAPRATSANPKSRATVTVAQPNIMIYADDVGGSGIAKATMTLTNNGVTMEIPTTVTPLGVAAVATKPLSGSVTLRATITDFAGNVYPGPGYTFTVAVGAGVISSVRHNAARALQGGEALTVDLAAPAGGKASFDVIGEDNRVVAQNVPMNSIAAGQYRGNYTIPTGTKSERLRVVGRYVDNNNVATAVDAATDVTVLAGATTTLSITTPANAEKVATPLVVRGRAAANAVISVAMRVEGVKPLLLGLLTQEYRQDLDTKQVQADAAGNWATEAITLPKPSKVTDLRYVISVTQTDAAGRTSEPVTITVTPK